MYYKRRYGKIGHLFQGRYKSILCDRDSYLLELVRYIHLNAVRAGLMKEVDRYRWRSLEQSGEKRFEHKSIRTEEVDEVAEIFRDP